MLELIQNFRCQKNDDCIHIVIKCYTQKTIYLCILFITKPQELGESYKIQGRIGKE